MSIMHIILLYFYIHNVIKVQYVIIPLTMEILNVKASVTVNYFRLISLQHGGKQFVEYQIISIFNSAICVVLVYFHTGTEQMPPEFV